MKAIFESGAEERYSISKTVEITETIGTVDDNVSVRGIQIRPEEARPINLWYSPVTERWSIAWNSPDGRELFEIPESV